MLREMGQLVKSDICNLRTLPRLQIIFSFNMSKVQLASTIKFPMKLWRLSWVRIRNLPKYLLAGIPQTTFCRDLIVVMAKYNSTKSLYVLVP